MNQYYYVSADVQRKATPQEIAEIGVPGASIHLCRVKTIVDAQDVRDAIAQGRERINASMEPGNTAHNFGAIPVFDARTLGDEEIYSRMRTV